MNLAGYNQNSCADRDEMKINKRKIAVVFLISILAHLHISKLAHYFIISSIFLSFGILPVSSSIRISFASFKNSEAKINSLRRWFLLKIISLFEPSHSFLPWYIYK